MSFTIPIVSGTDAVVSFTIPIVSARGRHGEVGIEVEGVAPKPVERVREIRDEVRACVAALLVAEGWAKS